MINLWDYDQKHILMDEHNIKSITLSNNDDNLLLDQNFNNQINETNEKYQNDINDINQNLQNDINDINQNLQNDITNAENNFEENIND